MIEEWHPKDARTCGVNTEAGVVPLRIDYCRGGVAYTGIDQHLNPNQWNKIAQLPFYPDIPGKISFRKLSQDSEWPRLSSHGTDCAGGECLWMADAFKVTWLASTCQEADRLAAKAKAEAAQAKRRSEALAK